MTGSEGGGRESGPVYFTTHQVARLLGVSLPTVVNWHKSGRIKAHRTPGGHRRISRDELVRFASQYGYPLPQELTEPSEGPHRVLVVDGDRDFGDMVCEFLQIRGDFEVRQADGAFAAGYLLGSFKPEVVVLGIGIPGLDPPNVQRTVEGDEELGTMRVIACASVPDPAMEWLVANGTLAAFLRKPIQLDLLLNAITQALGPRD